ncbi:MAG: hypothetical protein AB7L18_07380, partial [Hyphomicrobiaceae bacterium]
QVIAKSLTEEQTRALALYLGRIKPAAPSDATAANPLGPSSPAPSSPGAPPSSPFEAAPSAAPVKRITDDKTAARVARWIERGEAMLNAGDIAQARLLLERATEYGNPRAAFLMATSFDPNALPWRTGMGLVAEPLKAKRWYVMAKNLGAGSEADQRLADLP